jgi:hypothetical protein
MDDERMWFPEEVTPQSHPRATIPTPEVVVSIFWSSLGFPLITMLPSGTKFIPAHFSNGIIPKVIEGMTVDLANSSRQLMLHIANAAPRRASEPITSLKKF